MARRDSGISLASGVPSPAVISIPLFRSFHLGFGDSREIRLVTDPQAARSYAQSSPSVSVQARYHRAHGSVDTRWPGELRPGMAIRKFAAPNHDSPPVFSVRWTDSNGVFPAIYYLVDNKIMKFMFTSLSTVTTLPANVTGGMFDDDGSGVPYLYASFGGASTAQKIRRMNLGGTVTASTDVVAGLMLSLNGKAYRTIVPAGGTAACQVSVCPYGSDRMVAANWGAGTTVGFAGTNINALVAVRNAPVCVKPEGIFAYNSALDQWVNYTPGWRQYMHLQNGIGSFFLGDQLVVPMGDGGAVIFDGNNVRPFDPGGLLATPNEHTTIPEFTATGAMRHWIVGTTAPFPFAKALSFRSSAKVLYTTDGSTYTDVSNDLTDLDLTTGFTVPSNSALRVYIGNDVPFVGFHFATSSPNTNANTMAVNVWTGSSWTSVSVRDFTRLGGASFGQTENVIMLQDPLLLGWQKNTINGITKYWIEVSWSTALSASTTWLTVKLLPLPRNSMIDSDNFPDDALDRAGAMPHILYGRVGEGGESIWHDMGSLPEPDRIGQVIFGDFGGNGTQHSRNLALLGRFGLWIMEQPANDRPGSEQWPILHSHGLIEGPQISPVPGAILRLSRVVINGFGLAPDEFDLFFYYQWDWGKEWSRMGSRLKRFPEILYNPYPGSVGTNFRWAIGWKAVSGAGMKPSAPVITGIDAEFEVVTDRVDERIGDRPPR
jgi:hypothetical protein